jgi:hypothetical protein
MMMGICEINNSVRRWEYFAALERSLIQELNSLLMERTEKERSLLLLQAEMQDYINQVSLTTSTASRSDSS